MFNGCLMIRSQIQYHTVVLGHRWLESRADIRNPPRAFADQSLPAAASKCDLENNHDRSKYNLMF